MAHPPVPAWQGADAFRACAFSPRDKEDYLRSRTSRSQSARSDHVAPGACVIASDEIGWPAWSSNPLRLEIRVQSRVIGWRRMNSAMPRATGSGRWSCRR